MTNVKKSINSLKKPSMKKYYNNKKNNLYSTNDITTEVLMLVIIAITFLLFLGNLGINYVLIYKISYIFFGLFGVMEYIFPIFAFIFFGVILSNKGNKRIRNKSIFIAILFVLICSVIQLFYGYSNNYFYYFTYSALYKIGGGFFGCILAKFLGTFIGDVGACIILFISMFIMVSLITGKTIIVNLFRKVFDKLSHALNIANSDVINEQYEFINLNQNDKINDCSKYDDKYCKKSLFNMIKLNKNKLKDSLIKCNIAKKRSIATESVINDMKVPAKIMDKNKYVNYNGNDAIEKDVKNKILYSQLKTGSGIYKDYKFPSLSLLKYSNCINIKNDFEVRDQALKINMILSSFGVNARVVGYNKGPSVTQFEIQLHAGVKVKKISDLANDIKLGLAVHDIRIEAPIPGKSFVGIEVPNKLSSRVMLRNLIESPKFQEAKSKISFVVGCNVRGEVVVSDIAKLPHLLIGGSTGSGKSVFMNTLIMSILYKASPDEVKFFMIDPKMIELSIYNKLPHLVVPVVTDPKKAAGVLNYAVIEMTKRYKLFSMLNVKNLEEYNEKLKTFKQNDDKTAYIYQGSIYKNKPYIVIVVDEFADLMMVAKNDVEESVCRLAQLARAAGIHLILATQRPSVDVITGIIKANMPSRCALLVSSGIDSRTIIDQSGAEKLLGNGDMLYSQSGMCNPVRIQGAYVSGNEVENVVNAIIKQNGELQVDKLVEDEINTTINNTNIIVNNYNDNNCKDEFFIDAGILVIEKQKASVGMLQRQFRIGFNRAARIMDELCKYGVVSKENGTKPREVLITQVEDFKTNLK